MLTNLHNYDYKIWLSYIETNNEIGDTYTTDFIILKSLKKVIDRLKWKGKLLRASTQDIVKKKKNLKCKQFLNIIPVGRPEI